MSQLTVPRASGRRLPYDDAASPQEMFGDCVAAGQNLIERCPGRSPGVGRRP